MERMQKHNIFINVNIIFVKKMKLTGKSIMHCEEQG